jgi:hypothetical protein
MREGDEEGGEKKKVKLATGGIEPPVPNDAV